MKKWRYYGLALFIFVIFLNILLGLPQTSRAAPLSPQEAVEQAWSLARASGRYSYRSLIDQTVYPAPSVANAGRPPRQDRLAIEGNVDAAAATLNLTLWDDGSFDPQRGLTVKVEDGQTYGRRGQGEWQEMDNVADAFAPGGDPLGFLAGATNIQSTGTESRDFEGLSLTYSHYTFEMDGPAFARYMLAEMEAYYEKYGARPAGMELAPPDTYQRMTGQGELWVNEAGLPAQLIIRVELPDQPKEGERVAAAITNNYFDFDLAQLGQATVPFWTDPATWASYRLSQWQPAVQAALPALQLLPLAFLLVYLSLRYWRTRPFYNAVIGFVILSMLFSPLLQGHQGQSFLARLRADQAAQKARQAEAEERQALADAGKVTNWNPHVDPFAAAKSTEDSKQLAVSSEQLPANGLPLANSPLANSPLANSLLATTDSDADDLSDEDEDYWGTCAFTVGSPAYNSSEYCAGVTDPTDSDGDGLDDATEVNFLNTYPTSADTDGDSITDTLEIQGFTYAGQTWYLDPINEDSNEDGLVDSGECDLSLIDNGLAAACPDSDGDGAPNVFDEDNDGDGVPDADDLSPGYASPETYTNDNPFLLSLNNFTVGAPILLDIQLKPTTNDHLNYYYHVLDWPQDDEGQIQRHLDTTWASTSNSTYQSDDANAANGDIRLVPMLEIIMPYSSGHYANLPVNSTYAGTSRTLGVAIDDWLDTDVTEPYSMSLDDLDLATGDLVAYVPLSLVTDENDKPVGYTTRLIYEPGQASWGNAHQYRVVWLVQMLTDECINADDDETTCARQDTVTVIHSYDESWTLTGLNASEEHGLDVALLYENPATDDDLGFDAQLWGASWNLGNTFLRGRDCDTLSNGSCVGNGQRDVTIANLSSNLTAWDLDYTEVDTFSYEHQGFTAYIMMTETVNILDTIFTPYASATVPTILVAQEHSSRALNLDSFTGDISNGLVMDLSSGSVPLQLQASLSWASYDYVDGAWQNYEAEQYLEYLNEALATDSYFQATDSSQAAADEAEGKLIWAQSYYASLYAGAQAVIAVDGTIAWEPSVAIPEVDLDPLIPVNSGWGAATIATEFALVYAAKKISVEATETGIWAYFKNSIQSTADDGYQFTRFNQGGLSANKIAILTILLAVIAIAYIVAGLITGNETYVQLGVKILSLVTIIVSTFYIINAILAIIKAVQGVVGAVSIVIKALSAGRWFQGVGVIGFIIGTIVTWGVVGIMILTKGLTGIALGYTLALAIASTIVLFIYLILDLIGLGIIVLILVLFDALFALFGAKGPTQLLTEAIADTLYGVYYLIKNLDDSDRLNLDLTSMAFANDDLGFTIGNSFIFSLAVTNTLRYDNDYSFSDLEDRTVFRYFAQDDEDDQHSGLVQGEMVGEWVAVDGDEARASDVISITIPLSRLGTGIDQSLDGEFYVTEAYIAPYQGCWEFAGIPTDCTWYKFSGSSHINMGQEMVYDVLPGSLRDFVQMDWDNQLPDQVDIDNDGLTTLAGTDPDSDEFDSDGDGLSDYYEILYGLDAEEGDGDRDGLNDAQELVYGTNPFAADSDSDGLNDYLETKTGWLVVYENNGQSWLTRAWSDPNSADADEDTLNDLEEFLFGFHPQVASDPSSVSNLVQFNNLEVGEETNLLLLTQFEESLGVETFFDGSGAGNTATCDTVASACPTLEQTGRYGYAAAFSTNDYLDTGSGITPLATGDFSIGAWVKTTSTNAQAIVSKNDSDTTWEIYEKSFYLNNLGRPTFVGFGNGYIQSTQAVNDGQWHHVMVVWDYSGSGTAGTGRMYVDGVNVTAGSTNYIANRADAAAHTVKIGRPNFGEAPNYFNGSLDEIVVLDKALAADEVLDMVYGRYNINDLIVPPGTELTYQATVTNTSSTTAAGFLSAATTYVEPDLAWPTVALGFEPEQRIAYFTNALGEENNIWCVDDGTCPTAGIDGAISNGIAFDGLDDYVTLPGVDVRNQQHFSLNFWLYVESLPASGQQAMILDTDSTATGAMDVYLNSTGNLVFEVIGDTTFISNYSFSGNLNQWVHVSHNEGNIFINAGLNTSGSYPSVVLGPGRLGNNMAGTQPFDGRIDELVYYDSALDDGSNGGTSFNAIADVRNGSYYTDETPRFLFALDELIDYDGTVFYDSQSNSNHATCSPPTCPTLTGSTGGHSGRAVTFDGVDDYLTQPGSSGSENTTLSFWVNLNPAFSGTNTIFDSTTNGHLDFSINSSGRFAAARSLGTHTSTGAVPTGQWVQISITYREYWQSGNCYYDSDLYFNGVFDSRRNYYISSSCGNHNFTIGPGRIGNSTDGLNAFEGSLDDMSLLVANHTFDPPSTNFGYQNLANDYRAAACDDVFICPAKVSGRFDQGVSFDGVENYLDLGTVLDPSTTNLTAAIWFNVTSTSNSPVILQQLDGTGTGRSWLQLDSTGVIGTFLGGSLLLGTTNVTPNAWHHAAVTYDGTTLRLYLDGNLEAAQARTMETSDGEMTLGRHKTLTNRYFSGYLDELVILPAAADEAGIQMLLNSTWPAIDIPALFETFAAAALTNLEVSGTAEVSPYATTSQHQFDQEVEAALVLQAQIDYPVVDPYASNLRLFIPFEETPGSTVFDNLIPYNTQNREATCTGTSCPTAGLRGQVDRAVYFDGLDDYLVVDTNDIYTSGPDIRSLSVWINAKRGTIVDAVYGGSSRTFHLDMNLLETYRTSTMQTALELPRAEWFHLVITIDSSNITRIYINGVEEATGTNQWLDDIATLYIGGNRQGQDFLEGYLDDLRFYDTTLSAAAVLALYTESAPVIRFEFDEDSDATTFVDNSVNGYVGQPTTQTCAELTLNSLTINSLATNPSEVFVSLDGERVLDELNRTSGESLGPDISTILCGQQTLAVGVVANSAAATLGSVALNVTTPGTSNQTFTSGGNSITLNWTVDSTPIYQPNPAPGTSGRIANGALFDGTGYVTVTDTTVPFSLVADFTIAAWINTTAVNTGILVKSDGDNSWERGEKAFYLDSTGQPTFVGWGNNYIRSNTAVNDGYWHYVVVVWDYNGSGTTGTGKIYIDGVDATGTVNYRTNNADNSGDTLKIGGTNNNTNEARYLFDGQMDELAAYQRALSEAELYSIYLREIRWYRDRATSYITVDTDNPTVELLSDGAYWADGYIQLAVATTDPTSSVALVDFGLKGPGASSFTWAGAQQCQDNGVDGAAWCPSFDSSTLGGEGQYEMQFRVVDAVGNETLSPVYTLYVDGTSPTASGSFTGQWATLAAQDDERLNWTVNLSGTLSDPNLNTTPAVAGSGVVTNTVLVELLDAANGLIGEGEQQATVTGTSWSVNYRMEGARPQGTYAVRITLADHVGNVSLMTLGTIRFDERPPKATFDSWEVDAQVISTTLTLSGNVSDQADWAGEAAHFAFEEGVGSSIFYDSSANGVHLNCTNCPTVVSSGRFGQALDFDGVNDTLSTYTGTNTPFEENALTLALWVKPDVITTAVDRFVTLGNETAVLRIDNQRLHFYMRLDGTLQRIFVSNIMTAGVWQHIAGTYDGQTMRLYRNGIEVGTLDVVGEINHTAIPLQNMFLSSGTETFDGQMDEVGVYDRALSDAEIFALAQSDVAGVQSVEIGRELFDFTGTTPFAPLTTWSAAAISNGSWSYTIPANVEGLYNLHLRSTDNFGNVSHEGIIWSGVLDTQNPVVTAVGQHSGGGSASQTQYTFTFSDFILDESRYTQPCGANELVNLTYNNVLLPYDGMTYNVTATCRVAGHEISRDFTACDTVGHCTTVNVTPAPSPNSDSIAILTPGNLSPVTSGVATTINGGAYDLNQIQTIVVRVDGMVVGTIVPGVGITDTTWATNWTPTVTGTVTVAAAMTDTLGNTITDTIQLMVQQGGPTAITLQAWGVRPVNHLPFGLAWVGWLALATAAWWWRRKRDGS
ncbi:MAG: hypothetical protein KA314_02115 [Chloroflexi bacterium]|nr:hypothetical protein [Chloroflexota bacterium]MBP8054604.1 hypothetical protein [Chloroflexota bacterium]